MQPKRTCLAISLAFTLVACMESSAPKSDTFEYQDNSEVRRLTLNSDGTAKYVHTTNRAGGDSETFTSDSGSWKSCEGVGSKRLNATIAGVLKCISRAAIAKVWRGISSDSPGMQIGWTK